MSADESGDEVVVNAPCPAHYGVVAAERTEREAEARTEIVLIADVVRFRPTRLLRRLSGVRAYQ